MEDSLPSHNEAPDAPAKVPKAFELTVYKEIEVNITDFF